MTIRSSFLASIIGSPGAAWSPLAMVPADESAGGASASSYGDSEVTSFVAAAVKVQRINDAYVRKVGQAKSAQEKQQLEQQASGEMVQAVKKEGLTVDKYRDIANRMQSDEELALRIKQKLMEVT